jgi:hypothetical protein
VLGWREAPVDECFLQIQIALVVKRLRENFEDAPPGWSAPGAEIAGCPSPILGTGQKSVTVARRLAILPTMRDAFGAVGALRSTLAERRDLILEYLALRHQLGVLARSGRRFRPSDRLFWLCLRRWWPRWKDALMPVKPALSAAGVVKGSLDAGAAARAAGPEGRASIPNFSPSFGA